ncbi:MAG: hypothetical protein KF802_16260 [Bdellovibrionaceae bacterium]|nr:hypothetical protein [Pseudobdellovibrionaceae bacterium]
MRTISVSLGGGWLVDIIWNGSAFYAIASGSDKIVKSADAINWTGATLPYNTDWASVAWSGSRFCAVAGNGESATSTDGSTWSAGGALSSSNWGSVASNGTNFCAVGMSSKIATSPTGATWTNQTAPGANYRQVIWNGSVYCAVGSNSNVLATSATGTSWTSLTMPASGTWSLAAKGSLLCAVDAGAGMAGSKNAAISTNNGASWSMNTNLPSTAAWSSICTDGTNFYAVANGTDKAAISADGVTWTAKTLPSSGNWNGIRSNSL